MRRIVPAGDYNRVRLALRRLGRPLRVTLEGMRCLEVILDDERWLCVDGCAGDRPVLAWTAFQSAGRDALNADVRCELHFYHVHSGLVMGEILQTLGEVLARRLRPHC